MFKRSDGWKARPKEYPTIQVSKLPDQIKAIFRKVIGKRRWTTHEELHCLLALEKYKFSEDNSYDKPSEGSF